MIDRDNATDAEFTEAPTDLAYTGRPVTAISYHYTKPSGAVGVSFSFYNGAIRTRAELEGVLGRIMELDGYIHIVPVFWQTLEG
jgi:hypothetical protein